MSVCRVFSRAMADMFVLKCNDLINVSTCIYKSSTPYCKRRLLYAQPSSIAAFS
jgi:hypothetical protein